MTHTRASLATAVVGAGPAGLLFAILARMLAERAHGANAGTVWPIFVFDKRAEYARTHRLRMAPAAYHALQREIDDPRLDGLIGFLEETEFTPEVNVLEERLIELLASVGCEKELLDIGEAEDQISVRELRQRLVERGTLDDETLFTVVAADSVHSGIREWVRGDVAPLRQTHERIARIRVTGEELPKRLAATDQVRLAKVLGSVLDYRLNRNGFAEVDLFLTEPEFDLVQRLGASPREPVVLRPALLGRLRAPLFRAIVAHLGEGPKPREVLLQSTFRLEHAIMPTLAFERPEVPCWVFLLGDAGISLPFQRGMSSLARCACALAKVHADLLADRDGANRTAIVRRYETEARTVVREELAVVRSRAQVVRTLREIVRVSALLPFPIQSWWLRAREPNRLSDRLSVWFFLNIAVAAAALGATVLGYAVHLGWAIGALALEAAGGIVYHSALAFEGGPHRLVRRIWEIQIAAVFVLGVAVTVRAPALGLAQVWWLLLGVAFVVGLYAFERIVTGWFRRAGFAPHEGS